MKTWGRLHTLAAGLALVLVANAVVVAGVAYNRSGEPDTVLRLTEREFQFPHPYGFQSENSGLALRLNWRLPRSEQDPDLPDYGHGGYGGLAPWLDRAKLIELGFDMSMPPEGQIAAPHYDRQLPREALLVLEFEGPAHQAALQRAEQRAGRATATNTDAAQLAGEKQTYSRLFAVDAGLDHAALRAKYPDRTRYAIVRGKIGVRMAGWPLRSIRRANGYVSELSVATLNVPVEFRDVISRGARYTATVTFGRRLEPWLSSATTIRAN